MSTSFAFLDRFNELPRALRWLAVALVGTALFLFWHDVLYAFKQEWDAQAQQILRDAQTVRNGQLLTAQLRNSSLRETVLGIGAIDEPGPRDEESKAIVDAVTQVFSVKYKLPYKFAAPTTNTLPREASTNIVDGEKRLGTYTCELRFEAKPEQVIAIIADLEQRPEIESVNSVRLTKKNDGSGKLEVRVDIGTWIVKPRS